MKAFASLLLAGWVVLNSCCCGGLPTGTGPASTDSAATTKSEPNPDEYQRNGLVLLRKTLKATRGGLGGEVTGTVENRTGRKLTYAQVTFSLFDESGAQVGTAIANINNLEAGGRWNFKATTFGTDYATYKISDLSGF